MKRLLSAFCLLGLSLSAAVPTPESVLGHKPGDDFFLASYDESLGYFQKLAAASDRVKLVQVGKTTQGRDWYIALISSPENLAQLDKYKTIATRLAHVKGLDDAQAHALARDGKAIVHIDAGLHATEVAPAQHAIQLAYELASAQGKPEVDQILNQVILVLWFSINPDGQNMVVNWYRQNVGTPFEVAAPPFLYQEYVGHDNNRDGYMNNMVESRVVTKTTLEYNPQVFYNHHQTAPFPARIWIPPFAEPVSSNAHPLMFRWVNVFGTSMAAYLEDHGMPGAMHRGRFDDWYPGFIDHVNSFRNTVSFLTETALYRYATPHFYTVDEFPKEKQELRAEVFYASPWKGGWWRLSDAVNYIKGASMAVLSTAAKNREELLFNRYQAGRDTVRRFQNEPPYAYVISAQQRDLPEAATLVEKLMINGIEVHQAGQPMTANGMEYATGSWVIFMDQPYAALVKDLMEPQRYPDLRLYPGGPPELPYDVTGWTLPMQMGVEVAPVLSPVDARMRDSAKRVEKAAASVSAVSGSGTTAVIPHSLNNSFALMNAALKAGGKAALSPADGSFALSGLDRAKLAELHDQHAVPMTLAATAPQGAVPLKQPRVGLYRSWVPVIDEGWTRWILENYGFRFVSLYNADVQAGHLHDRFDAILIPDSSTRNIVDGYAAGSVPGRYAGGLGQLGVDELRAFVQQGGTLITFNNASLFAIEKLNLPVTNVLADLKPEQFFCSGSVLKVENRAPKHTAMLGLPEEINIMFERGPAFEAKKDFDGVLLAAYPKDRNPLQSGFLLHPERLQGKAAALDVKQGKGHVILIGFKPQWRAQSHGTYKLFFNSLFLQAGLPVDGPKPEIPKPVEAPKPEKKEPAAADRTPTAR